MIFLAEQRNPNLKSKDLSALAESSKKKQFKESEISETSSRGSLVDYESHKITTTTMSTTVAELGALMRCFGTCLFLKGLWADLSGEIVPRHIRADANNLVTTAGATHLPEQKETHHLIQMLRKESNSGPGTCLLKILSGRPAHKSVCASGRACEGSEYRCTT